MNLKTINLALRSNSLSQVSLERIADVNPKEFRSFLRRLKRSENARNVTIRTDFFIDLSEEQITSFFSSVSEMKKLQALKIQSSSRFHVQTIPVESLKLLKTASSLQSFELEDMQITAFNKSWISALAYIVENHPSLTTIRLRNFFANDFSNESPNILDPLIWTVATVPNLQTFEFSGCGSHALCGQTIQLISPIALSKLLQTSTNLLKLDLSFLELEDTHFETIANHLQVNTSITELTLDYHRLGCLGFDKMMKSMEKNITIKLLSLRSLTDIGDVGYQQAMNMLRGNYTIEQLSVTASHPTQQAEIDLYLRMNNAGRSLLQNPNTPLHKWLDVLAGTSDDLDVTRHLIQEIPELCSSSNDTNITNPVSVDISTAAASPA